MTSKTRKRVILAVTGAFLTLGVAGCMSAAATESHTSKASAPTASTTKPKATNTVSAGLAARDARADVKIGKWSQDDDPYLSEVSAHVTITNHSHKRSDYSIEVSLDSANGKTQYDTDYVFVDGLEAGQTVHKTVQFFNAPKHLPKTSKINIKTLERMAS